MIALITSGWILIKRNLNKETLKKLWEWIKSLTSSNKESSVHSIAPTKITTLIEDNSGGYSSIRVAMLMTLSVVLFIWSIASIDNIKRHEPLPDIPTNIIVLVSIVGGGKVIQKLWE